MITRALGQTGLTVSVLGFGAGHIGSPELEEDEVGRLLHGALDRGITLIDTARSYGLSEARIGRHLAHRRDEFVLVSKCGYGITGVEDWTPACITAGIDAALDLLRTDRLDVMLLHSCPRDVLARDGLLAALERAVTAGKVRVAGYSGENEDLAYAVATGCFGVIETSVNLFDQRGIDTVVAEAVRRGMGVIAKRPLGNAPWRFAERPHGHYAEVYWERMHAMAMTPGQLSWDELALRFAAFQPGVAAAIAGTARLDHLIQHVAVVQEGPLPDLLVADLRDRFRTHDRDWAGRI